MTYSRKILITTVVMLVIGILVIGCEAEEAVEEAVPEEQETVEAEDWFTITDMAGRTVEVPRQIDSVATLCGCAHRLLVYLDAAEMISGVRESEKREPLKSPWNMAIASEIENIPVISGEDAETISAVQPDIMVATQTAEGFDFFEHQSLAQKVDVPLVILRPYISFHAHKENVFESINILGEVLDREDRAKELVGEIEEIINDLGERTKEIPDEDKPAVYVGGKAWAGSMGLDSTSAMYSAFDFIHADNVASGLGEENAFIDKEALLMWDPDYIFVEATGYEQAMEELRAPEFETLQAVQNDNVYRIFPKIWTNTNHETVLINAYYIGSVIYPEQFADVDITEKADQIFEVFLGKSVYSEMVDVHGELTNVKVD